MTKRISRKALALAAVGILASPAIAQVANAQIITKTIAVTLKAVGPVPAGVSGANVTVSCQNTTNNPGAITSAFTITPGQTANLNNFNLSSVAPLGSGPGSSCSVAVTVAGSANTSKGALTIAIGGATSTSGTGGTAGAGFSTGGSIVAGSLTLTSNTVAIFDSTDVQITLSYPQITVKKVVVGDEATAGFAYPMSIACSNPTDVRFISPANGLEGGSVTIPTSSSTSATRAFRAVTNTRQLTMNYAAGVRVVTYTTPTANPLTGAQIDALVAPYGILSNTTSGTVPAFTTVAAADAAATNDSDVLVSGATTGQAINNVVVPGPNGVNYVLIPFFTAGPTAVAPSYAIFDSTTTGTLPTIAGATSILGLQATVDGQAFPAGALIWNGPTTTVNGVTLTSGQLLGATTMATYVNAILANAAPLTAASSSTGTVTVYPFNTNPVPAGGILGNWANLQTGNPSLYTQVLAQILKEAIGGPVAPNTVAGFTGAFALKGGESKVFSFNEFPNLTVGSKCEVFETNSGGATATGFSSTNGTAAPLAGLNNPNGRFQSSLTAMNETITVTNSFYGDMIISKVVTGDPKTNVATYEISVACDKGGPKDTFLIKDRQSKVYQNIASGTNCLITETKSDGAVASYKDNSGDNTTDGRVTIKRRPVGGCGDVLSVTGAPTNATPGGPAPTTTFNECFASVIVTNDYNPPATTVAPAAPATAAPATAAPATAAPAVVPAPAVAVDATPTFAG